MVDQVDETENHGQMKKYFEDVMAVIQPNHTSQSALVLNFLAAEEQTAYRTRGWHNAKPTYTDFWNGSIPWPKPQHQWLR